MAEHVPALNGCPLRAVPGYLCGLNLEGFAQMMQNPSSCYKFFWLEAIVETLSRDVAETTFSDLIDVMIAHAWHPVLEYHIHLSGMMMGEVRDALERAVIELHRVSGLRPDASELEIKNQIHAHEALLRPHKLQLTENVPYRALAGFFPSGGEKAPWKSPRRMIAFIRRVDSVSRLPYTLGTEPNLGRRVRFSRAWTRLIQDNMVPILGWIQFEKARWLQGNNPDVPGLVYKLAPGDGKTRKLIRVRRLWDAVLEGSRISDVFLGTGIDRRQYDVDHFIPWSYVMNDEFWNLMPITPAINASKGSRLPDWDSYFGNFARNQYILYTAIHDDGRPIIRQRFLKCFQDNLHSIWASESLYRGGHAEDEFRGILEKNMRPVYDSARRQGYQVWTPDALAAREADPSPAPGAA